MRFVDQSELDRRAQRRERQRQRDILWNVLTSLVVIATVGLIGYIFVLYSNPQASLNPFPPPTMPVLVALPTSTATPPRLPPTWTPTVRPTLTSRPTGTPSPAAETPLPAVETPTATATVGQFPTFEVDEDAEYPYALQGEPALMANTVFHPGDSCDWQGIAGTVVDLQGKPVVGVLVRLTGFYDGRTIEMNTLTGGASAWYGESGYEFILGFKPIESTATLAVQLVDQAMMPISNRVIVDTTPDCDKNLILVNFKQVR